MTAAEFVERYPGLAAEHYTHTDIAHAIRASSGGNLGDTFWCEVCVSLEELAGPQDEYSTGTIFEALSAHTAADWMERNEHALITELATSKRAGGISWELIVVGKSGGQLHWRVRSHEQEMTPVPVERPFIPISVTPGRRPGMQIK